MYNNPIKVKVDIFGRSNEIINAWVFIEKLPSGFYHLKSVEANDFEDWSMLFDNNNRIFYGV